MLLDKVRVYAAGAAVLATALLAAFFRFTLTGKAIRACADNPLGARVAGLPVAHLYAVTFGIGAASVAVAGLRHGFAHRRHARRSARPTRCSRSSS